jgi:Cdc37 C terminal domain
MYEKGPSIAVPYKGGNSCCWVVRAFVQEAFEERDIEKLHKALADMPIEEAKRHMKACEDSGARCVPQRLLASLLVVHGMTQG